MLSCAVTAPAAQAELVDFRQIPGITDEEIAAIENLREDYDSFVMAMMPTNTELFYDENGELKGYSAMLCDWLTEIFGITFIPTFYDWPDTLAGLADLSIDFTGELTATPERREYYYMTDSIGERTIKAIRYAGSKKVSESTAENPVRCCFLEGTTAYACVEPYVSNIEVIFAKSLSEVLQFFAEDKIDAFVVDGTAEAVFDMEVGVIAEEFSPMIYSPVSLSTQNPDLVPIIDAVQKILESDYGYKFVDMYKQGYADYLRRKLALQLTPEEKEYIDAHIAQGIAIPYIAEFDNYPVSFYNTREEQWQGISRDIILEISELTGLSFNPLNEPGTPWAEILPLLRTGDAKMASELIYSAERMGSYIWAEQSYMTDYLALLSTSEYADVGVAEISHARVGLVTDSAYAEFFYERFPDHKFVVEYDDLFSAVSALEHGDIDLLMAAKNILLAITSYLEKPGFKANLVFMRSSDSMFGFHMEETILRSIVGKAQQLVDTRSIIDRWQRMVFDYKGALAREQLPLFIGFAVLIILIIALLVILVIRSRHSGAVLEATVQERTKELEIQTKTNRAILDFNPFNSILFDEDGDILDCNLSAQYFFDLFNSIDMKQRFFEQLRRMVPENQKNENTAVAFYDRLKAAFDSGYCEFETPFYVSGRSLIFNITMKRVLYKNRTAVIVYMIDLTAQKEVQNSLKYHGSLLEALGNVANLLLITDVQDLDKTMQTALDMIGRAASVDKVYIWKNYTDENGDKYSSQLFEWALEEEPKHDSEMESGVPIDGKIADWHGALQKGQSISVLTKNTSPQERALLEARGIISLLMVPIFMQDKCWGFIGFDDCHNERTFLSIEENVLRICGFMAMVISDTIQNEVAMHLMAEREAALISAQIKSNFLANMSHEIRTPMNAIQGMTELIMHENINDTVMAHARDIRNACRGLLTIINDILDISKIESGKLEIMPSRYHISSLLIDVISIINVRTDKKAIAFLVNIDPDIPCELIGDDVRIKQILINLLNNAVKFTHEGSITLSVISRVDGDSCRLTFSVADTGIGIKQEDREKIFVLFQQIDTKKNRNIEGTGLGLSISKQLAEMMDGSINMESEYGVGSTFTVDIKQEVADNRPVASLKNPKRNSVLIYESRPAYLSSIKYTLDSLGCKYRICSNRSDMHGLLDKFECDYIFISSLSVNKVQEIAEEKRPNAVIVVLNGDDHPYYKNNVISVSMPIHCLQLANILNDEYESLDDRMYASQTGNIIAPQAKVLVVDDNAVNLKVAVGLLKTYKIHADTASGGMRALEMVQDNDYDLVFMDHMMPDMDGIDTAVAIRELGGEFEHLPIVALTANAVSGMREMFKAEGLNDFLPKPIEMSKLDAMLKKWIHKDKQQTREEKSISEEADFEITGIDAKKGIRNSGGLLEDYNKILAIYASDSENRLGEMAKHYREGDIRAFTICVHALKSASANVGADDAAILAADLEAAGKVGDIVFIDANIRGFNDTLELLLENIKVYLEGMMINDVVRDKAADINVLITALNNIELYIDNLDIDSAERVLTELNEYDWDENTCVLISKIKDCVDIFDYDGIKATVTELKVICGGK